MKVVVAMDSFKGSLSADRACRAVARGIAAVRDDVDVVLRPLADGGEGTARTLLSGTRGEWRTRHVTGPLAHRQVEAGYAWLPDAGPGALVEMAAASGLELLKADELDPLATTTRGTGELLADALERGARRLWLTIGGSATVDGGTGAATALGWRFLDADGHEIGPGGGALTRLERIEPPDVRRTAGVQVEVLCDVDNPLLGPRGAAAVFGPQKGADPAAVAELERGLGRLADLVERDLGVDVRPLRGGGAAGGLGAGAVAFFDARLVSGIDAVMDATGLDDALRGADWVVTGEGRLDDQSLHGKVVSGVLLRARARGVRVGVLAGVVDLDPAAARSAGIDAVEAAAESIPLDEAFARAEELVAAAASRLAGGWLAGGS